MADLPVHHASDRLLMHFLLGCNPAIVSVLTVSAEGLEDAADRIWVLDATDCLLMMESLYEDSLMDEETRSVRRVGDKNHRHGTFSAKVVLSRAETERNSSSLRMHSVVSYFFI